MPSLDERERVPVRKHILTHEVTETDEVVVYDGHSRQLLVLNHTGAGIWLLMDGVRSVDELVDALTSCTPQDRANVHADVTSFLEDLVQRKLVEWATP